MVNKIILLGRVGQDPEVKDVAGDKVVNLGLATTESWRDKSGEKQERTEWHRLQIWGGMADVVGRYVKKGDLLYVEGLVQSREYDKDGVTMRSTEVRVRELKLMPNARRDSDDGPVARPPSPVAAGPDSYKDDLPF